MEDIFLITAFRSMNDDQRRLFLDYAVALRDKPEIAQLLGAKLFATLSPHDFSNPNTPLSELFLRGWLEFDEGSPDRYLARDISTQ